MRTYAVINLGCKVNRAESDVYSRFLSDAGLLAASPEIADIVVINTCTVTAVADKKTRKAVRSAVRANSESSIIVTGCAGSLHKEEFERMSERVSVHPAASMEDIISRLESEDESKASASSIDDIPKKALTERPALSRYGVKVQDGCDNRCTYCIIWKARGPERSLPPDKILLDVRRLAEEGIREIMLTGINLGRYSSEGHDLTALLDALLSKGFNCRYRISSIEPPDISERLIDAAAEANGLICRHFHIPLQSASDKVLKEMGRPYDSARYLDLIERIRDRIPSVSITTDVIAGFPGESEADHEATMQTIRDCGFSKVHVFPYSMREGTPAASRTDQIPPDVKARRARDIRVLSEEMRRADLARRSGSIEWAVVESEDSCTTESYHEIEPPAGSEIGSLVSIRL